MILQNHYKNILYTICRPHFSKKFTKLLETGKLLVVYLRYCYSVSYSIATPMPFGPQANRVFIVFLWTCVLYTHQVQFQISIIIPYSSQCLVFLRFAFCHKWFPTSGDAMRRFEITGCQSRVPCLKQYTHNTQQCKLTYHLLLFAAVYYYDLCIIITQVKIRFFFFFLNKHLYCLVLFIFKIFFSIDLKWSFSINNIFGLFQNNWCD